MSRWYAGMFGARVKISVAPKLRETTRFVDRHSRLPVYAEMDRELFYCDARRILADVNLCVGEDFGVPAGRGHIFGTAHEQNQHQLIWRAGEVVSYPVYIRTGIIWVRAEHAGSEQRVPIYSGVVTVVYFDKAK